MCHKNIIKINEIIDDPSSKKVYLIMSLCQGGTLKEKLDLAYKGNSPQLKKASFPKEQGSSGLEEAEVK